MQGGSLAGLSVLYRVTSMMQFLLISMAVALSPAQTFKRAEVYLKGGPPHTNIPIASHAKADVQMFLSLGALCAGAPAKAPVAAPMMAPAAAPAAAAKAPAPGPAGALAGTPAPMGAAIATGGGITFFVLPNHSTWYHGILQLSACLHAHRPGKPEASTSWSRTCVYGRPCQMSHRPTG